MASISICSSDNASKPSSGSYCIQRCTQVGVGHRHHIAGCLGCARSIARRHDAHNLAPHDAASFQVHDPMHVVGLLEQRLAAFLLQRVGSLRPEAVVHTKTYMGMFSTLRYRHSRTVDHI